VKVIILAGGLGTRISEETGDKPKPMVLVNGQPIIWHLMNIFSTQGFTDFVIAKGYKGEVISNWLDSKDNQIPHSWKVIALDTGLETQTAGRVRKCMSHIGNERVLVTYGDGLANVNLPKVQKLITNDNLPFETSTLPELAATHNLAAFHHEGFWQPMDTIRERNDLEVLALNNPAPWLAF